MSPVQEEGPGVVRWNPGTAAGARGNLDCVGLDVS